MTYFRHHSHWGQGPSGCNTPANPQTETDGSSVVWKLQYGNTVVNVTAKLDGKGNVVFEYDANNGKVDLTGFYLDIGNDGGKKHAANLLDWMVGRDSDGDRMDGFDFTATIGTPWGWDANNTDGKVTVSLAKLGIDSLDDLNGAEVGFTAQIGSGWCKQTVRLADTGTYIPAEPAIDGEPVAGYVEMADSQIEKLVLSFYVGGAPEQHSGDQNGDWYYTVEVDVPLELSEDPDAYLDQLVADLIAADPNLTENSNLKSVIVIEADGDMTNYGTTGGTSQNGEAPDELPWNVFNDFDHMLDDNTNLADGIESVYALTLSGDAFILA